MNIELEFRILNYFTVTDDISLSRRYINKLQDNFFLDPINKRIYNKIKQLIRQDKIPDTVTLFSLCTLDEIKNQLSLIASVTCYESMIEQYIADIKNVYYKQELIKHYKKNIDSIIEADNLTEFISDSLNINRQIILDIEKEKQYNLTDILKDCVADIELTVKGNKKSYVDYGIQSIDNNLKIVRGQIHTIGAQSGRGKTALALSCALKQLDAGYNVAYFCSETSSKELLTRIACLDAEVSFMTTVTGFRNQYNEFMTVPFERYMTSLTNIDKYKNKLFVYGLDNIKFDLNSIAITLDTLSKSRAIDVCYIDFLQDLIAPYELSRAGIYEQVTYSMKEIHCISERTQCQMNVLSQLNRGVFNNDKEGLPSLHDLKGSGQIEHSSHLVSFLVANKEDWLNKAIDIKSIKMYSAKERLLEEYAFDIGFYKKVGKFLDLPKL